VSLGGITALFIFGYLYSETSFIYICFCFFYFAKAQNLVPNGSFENIVRCPNYIANGSSPGDTTGVYAAPWENGNDGTIDLYSSCDTSIPPWPG